MTQASHADDIATRLRHAVSMEEVLNASFDAFEAIRITARGVQEQTSELLATFMTAADAAVDGREAITVAPSLPSLSGPGAVAAAVPPGSDTELAADALAAVAPVLRDRLRVAARLASMPGDRAACEDAAEAAGRICELMML